MRPVKVFPCFKSSLTLSVEMADAYKQDELETLIGNNKLDETPDMEAGVVEVIEQGKPGAYSAAYSHLPAIQRILTVIWHWPLSCLVFFLILGMQYLSRVFHRCFGTKWFIMPGQHPLVHSNAVFQRTIKETWLGWLFCCGGCVSPLPSSVLGVAVMDLLPPFMYDEEADSPKCIPLEQYIEKKKASFPPFSGRIRSIDGGGNNEKNTWAGQGYRGYGATHPFQLLTALPDPDELTQALFKRAKFRPASNGINSLSMWLSNHAIHDMFRTATGLDKQYTGGIEKPWVNLHSSYFDNQVLYGFNAEIARSIRTFSGGKIHKYAETRFAYSRITEAQAIVEMFRREHNYVCDELAKRYPEFDTDEKLYQQARIIIGGVTGGIIQRQLAIFGEHAEDGGCASTAMLPCGDKVQRTGNHGTFSFNLLYRWHTGIPEYFDVLRKEPPSIDTDEDIRKLFAHMASTPAGGHGERHVPAGLVNRPIATEAKAIQWGRMVGAPRLNDYRRTRINMRPYKDFMDLAQDAELASVLQKFYPTVEDVELLVGVQVEMCGRAGWCLPDTILYTVMADATNIIRQDRFLTDDFTPEVYTPWGFEHAKGTNVADLLNRHLNMGMDRNWPVGKLPGWKPTEWSEMEGRWWDCADGFNKYGEAQLKK